MTEFFTVGHSDRSLEDFLALLASARIGGIVDVRRLPGSRKYPWFDQKPLAAALQRHGIGYVHDASLTGRRPRQRDVAPEVNGAWRNQSFHNYADYALSAEFAAGLERLRHDAGERPAVMCSEAVWWRCHRRLIADRLLAAGEDTFHLMAPGQIPRATLTPDAVVTGGIVTYPAEKPLP